MVAERFLYIPSVGFCFLLAIILVRLSGMRSFGLSPQAFKGIAILLLILLLSFYSVTTIRRNDDWQDSFTFWSQTVRTSPQSPRARYNLGNAYLWEGKLDEAIFEYKTAIGISPAHAKAHNNLALAYARKEPPEVKLAERHLNLARKLGHEVHPGFVEYIENLKQGKDG